MYSCDCGKEFKNPGGLASHKLWCGTDKEHYLTIPLDEILEGKHPSYPTSKILRRLLKECRRQRRCEVCGLELWLSSPIPLEIHHKDGNKHNHRDENLQITCPNCHALTDTWKSRNIQGAVLKVRL